MFLLAFSVYTGACFSPMAGCSKDFLKYLYFQRLLQLFFFLFICFLLQGKNILCALFLAGLLKWGCEFNFLLVGSFLLSTKVEFLVLIYISLVFFSVLKEFRICSS